ncbi:uncharacterized protein MONBRDRAFT_4695 [Monosiga brevicollis MX1]|uniref:Sugar transporter SWEET1 n=1 Tax=Monosiga brevicollis TaxID=81824 RepID=A9UNN2_MONBE|nr:uncharacterized protein MONBRDRAFT_4695 [Monosiga brevicollis MX1]EDQ92271.1 predicted protein [Monosiga brevicollis MX1]|eukprot:XP_001742033.1 hypothetical protein [Monosiga brevicollis MX1]
MVTRIATAAAVFGAGAPLALAQGSISAAAAAEGLVHTAAGYALSPAVVGLLSTAGPACFFFLQISGAAPIRQIMREKTTGQFSLLPFISLFTNCVIWTWYGHLLQDPTLFYSNLVGVGAGAAYTAIYLKHATTSHAPMLLGSAALCSSVTAGALMLPAEQVAPYIGYLGDIIAVVLMASPLAVMKTVLQERSTRAMPFVPSLATFFNAVCWSGYGIFVMGDPLIIAPNMLGALAATVQLSLFARFGINK